VGQKKFPEHMFPKTYDQSMASQQSMDIPSLLHEALECLNGNRPERAQTLALICIAMSLGAPQPFTSFAHHEHDDSSERVAIAADAFFTKPEDVAFAELQAALSEWKTKKSANNA
jgi:hypothetical protein